jgi:hypothetical protein
VLLKKKKERGGLAGGIGEGEARGIGTWGVCDVGGFGVLARRLIVNMREVGAEKVGKVAWEWGWESGAEVVGVAGGKVWGGGGSGKVIWEMERGVGK